MITKRYDLRLELDGTWTVFDVFTGLPATIDADDGSERLATRLDAEEADYLLDLLNLADALRRGVLMRPKGKS